MVIKKKALSCESDNAKVILQEYRFQRVMHFRKSNMDKSLKEDIGMRTPEHECFWF